MIQTVYRNIALEEFKNQFPKEHERAIRLSNPILSDWDQIRDVVEFCGEKGYPLNSENVSFILAVIYNLFAPYKLYYEFIKMPIGLRDAIAEALNYKNGEMVNYCSELSRTYAKGKNWVQKYEAISNEYLNSISVDF